MVSKSQKNKIDKTEATILIVDDDDGLSTLMQNCLRAAGFKTSRTSSGKETLDWLSNHRADLMLLDHKLPDTTGRGMVRKLARRKQVVPFIAVSGAMMSSPS